MKYVVYGTDKNYWMPLYVSLYSLLINNIDSNFTVFIISDAKDDYFFKQRSFLDKIGNLKDLKFIDVSKLPCDGLPTPKHYTKANYYVLLLSRLLPEDVNKVLYLDCDTIIEKPLSELFDLDLKNKWLAATVDLYNIGNSERMGLERGCYFNSGVMMINLNKWRENNLEEMFFNYIQKYPDEIVHADQDVLNPILKNKWELLNSEYNFQEISRYNMKPTTGKISIIHYLGVPKPWYYLSRHPHKDRFWFYLRQTPYHDYKAPDFNLKNFYSKTFTSAKFYQKMLKKRFIYKASKIPLLRAIKKRIWH